MFLTHVAMLPASLLRNEKLCPHGCYTGAYVPLSNELISIYLYLSNWDLFLSLGWMSCRLLSSCTLSASEYTTWILKCIFLYPIQTASTIIFWLSLFFRYATLYITWTRAISSTNQNQDSLFLIQLQNHPGCTLLPFFYVFCSPLLVLTPPWTFLTLLCREGKADQQCCRGCSWDSSLASAD